MAHTGPALLALLVLGCNHAEPFAVSDPVENGPFAPGAMVRLTYGQGVSPGSWLPTGDTVVLAARDPDRHEGDVCLFLLPAEGGTRRGGFCSATGLQPDSVETFGEAAVSQDGAVAVPYFHRRVGGPNFGTLRAGPLASPLITSDLVNLPFAMDGRLLQGARDLGWMPDGSLIFLSTTDEVVEKMCDGLSCDELVRIGYRVLRLAPGGGAPVPVSGTWLATSATPDGEGGLFATFAGSDTLWHISASGDSVAVHDFGPGSGVRGADYQAGKVAVILGGEVVAEPDDIGMVQTLAGFGALAVLDLASGAAAVVSPPDMLFRDPAISPDGRSVVAIGTQFSTVRPPVGPPDTVVVRPEGDLWRIPVP